MKHKHELLLFLIIYIITYIIISYLPAIRIHLFTDPLNYFLENLKYMFFIKTFISILISFTFVFLVIRHK